MDKEIENTKAGGQFWVVFVGNIMIALGVVAIIIPVVISSAAVSFLGLALFIGGVFRISQLYYFRTQRGFIHELMIGIVCLLVGGWLAFFPLMEVFALMAFLAIAFLIEGGLEISKGVRIRPVSGWIWTTLSGAIAIAVGVLLLIGAPGTAVWAIGVLVGVNLISSGWTFIRQATVAEQA